MPRPVALALWHSLQAALDTPHGIGVAHVHWGDHGLAMSQAAGANLGVDGTNTGTHLGVDGTNITNGTNGINTGVDDTNGTQ